LDRKRQNEIPLLARSKAAKDRSEIAMNQSLQAKNYLIVGLGNPGREYKADRHNIGFMVLDRFSQSLGTSFKRVQFDSTFSDIRLDANKVILAKPQTFMNRSGNSVAQLKRYYRIPAGNLLVVFDDLDLPLGVIRVRPHGGSSGHRGMQSIIAKVGTQEFPRMRLGIGRPPGRMDASDYVLQSFSNEEEQIVEIQINRAVECIETFLKAGIESAMNQFNQQRGEG
jgi:PTH1 family peptidyl-tRNA hydrolase